MPGKSTLVRLGRALVLSATVATLAPLAVQAQAPDSVRIERLKVEALTKV